MAGKEKIYLFIVNRKEIDLSIQRVGFVAEWVEAIDPFDMAVRVNLD
jgi:hypothetical protein